MYNYSKIVLIIRIIIFITAVDLLAAAMELLMCFVKEGLFRLGWVGISHLI